MFTQKHFIAVAKLINETDGNINLDSFVSAKLIQFFQDDNPKFNKEIFLKACYDVREEE